MFLCGYEYSWFYSITSLVKCGGFFGPICFHPFEIFCTRFCPWLSACNIHLSWVVHVQLWAELSPCNFSYYSKKHSSECCALGHCQFRTLRNSIYITVFPGEKTWKLFGVHTTGKFSFKCVFLPYLIESWHLCLKGKFFAFLYSLQTTESYRFSLHKWSECIVLGCWVYHWKLMLFLMSSVYKMLLSVWFNTACISTSKCSSIK